MTQCSEPVLEKKEIVNQLTQEESNIRTNEENWIVSCICGEKENDGEPMVGCDNCIIWEHIDCVFPKTKEAPDGKYLCHKCNPRKFELTFQEARAYQDGVKKEKAKREEDKKERLRKEIEAVKVAYAKKRSIKDEQDALYFKKFKKYERYATTEA